MISCLTFLLFLPLVSTFPLQHRASGTVCGQFDRIQSSPYSVLNNLWGEASATSGRQCSTLDSVHGNSVRWSTDWTWTGDYGVKSFANIQLNKGINQSLSSITSMPSAWRWSQSATGHVVSDVAYDMFTSDSPGGRQLNEVMVWLANINAEPISYAFDADGRAVPIATDISLAGHTWDLHLGSNGYNAVWSFLPTGGATRKSFGGDMYEFFKYLIDNGHINASEYLVTAQAGTEATSGSAVFKTWAFTLKIN